MVLAEIGWGCAVSDTMAAASLLIVFCFWIWAWSRKPASCCSVYGSVRGGAPCLRFRIDYHRVICGRGKLEKDGLSDAVLNRCLRNLHLVDVHIEIADQQTVLSCIDFIALRL